MSIECCKEKFEEFADELNDLRSIDISEMLRFLIAQGNKLVPLASDEFIDTNYVHGCISNAYVLVESTQGMVVIRGHSDALVVRGFMAILSMCCQELTVKELAEEGKNIIKEFLALLDLNIVLTPSRANAFGNVVHLILKKGLEITE